MCFIANKKIIIFFLAINGDTTIWISPYCIFELWVFVPNSVFKHQRSNAFFAFIYKHSWNYDKKVSLIISKHLMRMTWNIYISKVKNICIEYPNLRIFVYVILQDATYKNVSVFWKNPEKFIFWIPHKQCLFVCEGNNWNWHPKKSIVNRQFFYYTKCIISKKKSHCF